MNIERVITVFIFDDGTHDVAEHDLRRPMANRSESVTVASVDKRTALEVVAKALDEEPIQ